MNRALTVVLPNMLACHPSLPVKDVKGLIALASKLPGQIEYASGSYGGSAHLIMELFLGMTKTKMLNVPYKEEFGAMMRSEVQKWAKVVKTAGIKAQ